MMHPCINCKHLLIVDEEERQILNRDQPIYNQLMSDEFMCCMAWYKTRGPTAIHNAESVFLGEEAECSRYAEDLPDYIRVWEEKLG